MKNKSNSNTGDIKILCYLGIFILLIFIVLPPLFRVLFPEEEVVKEEEDKLIMNLYCEKEENFVEYKIKTTINTNYVESIIDTSTFTYEIEILDNMYDISNVEIEEYEAIKKISNVDFSEENNKYVLNINYTKFDYSNEPLLMEHKNIIQEQLAIYTQNNFECKTTKVQ